MIVKNVKDVLGTSDEIVLLKTEPALASKQSVHGL